MNPNFSSEESARIERIRKKRLADNPEAERLKSGETSAKHRSKKRKMETVSSATCTTPGGGFRSPQGLGKAVKRLQDVLPRSPNKRNQTIHGLAKSHDVQVENTMNEQLSKTAMSEDVIKLVKEFYVRSNIVYTMLGMKDEITIWTDSKKQKLRKFYLCMYIKEVYRMFQSAYPDIQIGFSKFASLRPQNVLLLKDQPEDQCKCKMHENFTLKLKALKIEYNDEFWQSYLCDGADLETECWRKECDKCKCGRLFLESMEQQDNREPIVWKKWCKDKSSGETSLASHCCLQLITMTKVKMQS